MKNYLTCGFNPLHLWSMIPDEERGVEFIFSMCAYIAYEISCYAVVSEKKNDETWTILNQT